MTSTLELNNLPSPPLTAKVGHGHIITNNNSQSVADYIS